MDQLAEYRARQQQRFASQQLHQEQAPTVGEDQHNATTATCVSPAATLHSRPPRPCALKIAAQSPVQADSVESCGSCPGTPRTYRARQQERFAAEKLRRQREQESSNALEAESSTSEASVSPAVSQEPAVLAAPTETNDADGTGVNLQLSNPASPPTPRLRGSSSLRAISAARSMRAAEAVPLPGASWPGHSQAPSRSEAASGYSSALPPRPRTPSTAAAPAAACSAATAPSPRRPSSGSSRRSQSSGGYSAQLPPRPPTPSRRSLMPLQSLTRTPSSCALSFGRADDRTMSPGMLCF